MAHTTMVNPFLNQMRTLVREVESVRGRLSLLILAPASSGLDGKWTLIASARWIDQMSMSGAINALTITLQREVERQFWEKIERIRVLGTGDPFVANMRRYQVPSNPGYATLNDVVLHGEVLGDVIIFKTSEPVQQVQTIPRVSIRR